MTVIFSLLIILYALFIILAVIALLYVTPMLMEKVSWLKEKSVDEKVLVILPVHLILIILAVTSVWKLQLWKADYDTRQYYEQIRTGNAPIPKQYASFLVDNYPDVGRDYQRIVAEEFIIVERLKSMRSFRKSLVNQDKFINNVIGRWGMMLDQLGNLRATIETRLKVEKKSELILEQTYAQIKQEIKETYIDVLINRKRIEDLMKQYAAKSIGFLKNPVLGDPGHPVSSLTEKNYYRVISFFLSEYSELIDPLDLIIKKIKESNLVITNLKRQIKANKIKASNTAQQGVINDVLFEWEYANEYAHLRLLKILYALETESVLREMGMGGQHPLMEKLKQEIPKTIKKYSQDVDNLLRETKANSNPNLVLVPVEQP